MAGELSGVLDNDDPTESPLDDRLEIEQGVQGGESIGTATVSGACGGLVVKVSGIESSGVVVGFVNDIIVSVFGAIVLVVNVVIIEIGEIEDDEVDEIAVDDVNVGDTISDDISDEQVVANEFSDVTASDVTVVKAGVGDEVVNVVIGYEGMVVNDSSERISDGAIFDDVVAEELGDKISASDVIIDASGQGFVFKEHDNESRDSNETTDEFFDGINDACVEDVSIALHEVEVGKLASLMRTVAVLGFDSVANVSLLLESSMLVLRC